jgi:hypothetical protein
MYFVGKEFFNQFGLENCVQCGYRMWLYIECVLCSAEQQQRAGREEGERKVKRAIQQNTNKIDKRTVYIIWRGEGKNGRFWMARSPAS